ncbi:MAG TPA: hypothetical protein DDW33_03330 [Ktedonobacter sp.]|jgi:hypothetical protein|nr:hypothetical protein [Ktedonobacter sp.]HAT44614.1 hypothetical protein [Ktedonobacter sp.]HBE24702.1 hypothetical protein [Ktedonobacter sp.]HCP73556.1 hypothetical protein [Ktedonobacter sp.]
MLQSHEQYFSKMSNHARKYRLKSKYGLTSQQYDDMFINQMGVCAICGEAPPKGKQLHVDHSHETGQIRGLLCNQCNHMLGNAEDKVAVLKNAIQYLQKAGCDAK